MYQTLRIFEKLLIIYFVAYFLFDVALYFYALYNFSKGKKNEEDELDFEDYPISIIVPAYNEEVSVITCTDMLLQLDYPNYEVILVNDGSKDNTMKIVTENYHLETIQKQKNSFLQTANVKQVYKDKHKNLLIVDKENGGKADAINIGINYASGAYICTIDADSILDEKALKEIIKPFIKNKNTIVSGGQLAIANDVVLKDNKVVSSKVPKNIWVQWQIIEYIKSFMISRIGLSKINALLIMSGAFSLFKKKDLVSVGGFLSKQNTHPFIVKNIGEGKQTVCEDMEIVVRLWKYKIDNKIKAKAVFLPEPICWTEVPDNANFLFKQRSRWHQGLGETLKIYRSMLLDPKYGVTGLIALPYYYFFEFISPIMKIVSLIFVFVAGFYGVFNVKWVVLLLTGTILITAIIMSSTTLVIEYWSHKKYEVTRNALRYKTFKDWLMLLIMGILAEFSYSFLKIAAQITGIYNFIKRKHDWKKFDRKGIQTDS